jgi:D-tyrosyl-tRNA(Tyr) deacylase
MNLAETKREGQYIMRAVIQRVSEARVDVEGTTVGQISRGLLVFLGVEQEDTPQDEDYIVDKITHLRLFPNEDGKFDRSLSLEQGAVLVVSQFTLSGDARRGRRPSFSQAAPPQTAKQHYDNVVAKLQNLGLEVASGVFQAHMQVHSCNDGPVTILLDSHKTF